VKAEAADAAVWQPQKPDAPEAYQPYRNKIDASDFSQIDTLSESLPRQGMIPERRVIDTSPISANDDDSDVTVLW
jgi:hypothetical protein